MGKVLFIRGGAIGDFVLTLPAIKLLRESLPDNEIEILGDPGMAELALASGIADRARSIHDPNLANFYAPGATLDGSWCDYFTGFDLVLSYLYDPDHYFEKNLIAAGVETLFPFSRSIDETPGSSTASRQLAEPLEQLALFFDDTSIQLNFGGPAAKEKPTVVIHPGSGDSLRNWGFEAWTELMTRLSAVNPELHFQIVSGHAEFAIVEDLRQLVENSGVPCEFHSSPEFLELARLIQGADLYLGHDSGISQLAACTGIDGVVLFGPRDPEIWASVSPTFQSLRSRSGSLHEIRVDEVASLALELLGS